MGAITKQIKKLNVQNFLTFLTDAETDNAQHVLDIKDGKIYSKILNEAKEFIKHVSADLAGIGGDWSEFKDGAHRFYMTDLTKIIKAFEIAKMLKKEVVNVKCTCIVVESENYIRIDKMAIEGQLKLQITAKDGAFAFKYLEDSRFKSMMESPSLVEFDMDSEDVAGLKKIFAYLKLEDSKSVKEQGVHIHITKDESGNPAIKFTAEEEKIFSLLHTKNVEFHVQPDFQEVGFHAYIVALLNQNLYRMHIKQFGEVLILVAIPTSDAPRTIIIPLNQ